MQVPGWVQGLDLHLDCIQVAPWCFRDGGSPPQQSLLQAVQSPHLRSQVDAGAGFDASAGSVHVVDRATQ